MSVRRRSTRLQGISNTSNSTISTENLKTEVWKLRQPKTQNVSEESDESDDELLTTLEVDVLKERNDNRSDTTRRNSTMEQRNKKVAVRSTDKDNENEGLKTPRSSKHRAAPLSKKQHQPQTPSKRKTENKNISSDANEISPPKLSRLQRPSISKQLLSPSRLLDRLSIDERRKSTNSDSNCETNGEQCLEIPKKIISPTRNKYQNARRVLNSAETQNLPGREEQLNELRSFFTTHIDEQKSGSLYVSGQPGTGKTACLSFLLHSAEVAKRLQHVYINCTSIASVGSVYKKLCAELKINLTGRTERDHLDAIKTYLRSSKRMTLIVLDEIDQLSTARQAVLYTIFEWPALPGVKLLLVGIANSLDLTDRTLMRLNARCELKPQLLHFPSYTKQQIVEIFRSRLEEANVLDIFPPVTLQLLAAKVSAVSGDVRRALDIGRRVVEIAEQQKKANKKVINLSELNLIEENDVLKPVQVSQVVEVLNTVYGASQNLEEEIEESFPLQQKLMLCTLMLMLRNEKNKDITIGRLHEVYRRVCQKRNICALDQAEFAGLVDLVETRGILRLLRKKEPRLSKVQLQWDEEEVNAALSDKQLIATILNDTACLRSGG